MAIGDLRETLTFAIDDMRDARGAALWLIDAYRRGVAPAAVELRVLGVGMVVVYCRPFGPNYDREGLPPEASLAPPLPPDLADLHEKVRKRRNTIDAHDDAHGRYLLAAGELEPEEVRVATLEAVMLTLTDDDLHLLVQLCDHRCQQFQAALAALA